MRNIALMMHLSFMHYLLYVIIISSTNSTSHHHNSPQSLPTTNFDADNWAQSMAQETYCKLWARLICKKELIEEYKKHGGIVVTIPMHLEFCDHTKYQECHKVGLSLLHYPFMDTHTHTKVLIMGLFNIIFYFSFSFENISIDGVMFTMLEITFPHRNEVHENK